MYGPGFSVTEITFKVLFSAAHAVVASVRASGRTGSRPDGNAPACRETTKVLGPAETAPVVVEAHPARNAARQKEEHIYFKCFIKSFRLF